jgi:multiple sugar transport system permease protein
LPAEARAAFWFLLPALALIGVLFLLPALGALFLSFTDFDLYALADPRNARFVGLGNYRHLLSDRIFWKALGNTFYFVLLGGPLSVAVSLGAALLVNSKLTKARTLYRTVFFAPVVTTLVAIAVVFKYLYHPRFGWLDWLLGHFGVPAIDWLGDPRFAMPAIILLAVWKNFGYNMVIFIAGLQAIPPSLYEAAKIDGAGVWQQFRHVTLPLLSPTFVLVGLLTMIGYFQLFAEPYVMTRGGGPLDSTLSVALLMFKEGFRWWNLGYAAAVAFALFAVVLIVTGAQWAVQRRLAR